MNKYVEAARQAEFVDALTKATRYATVGTHSFAAAAHAVDRMAAAMASMRLALLSRREGR